MKRWVILIALLCGFCMARAEEPFDFESFYLDGLLPAHTAKTSTKLLPSTLRLCMTSGDDATVTCALFPSDAPKSEIYWAADASDVVAIDGKGGACRVHAIKAGNAMITVSTPEGLSAHIAVSVTEEKCSLSLQCSQTQIRVGESAMITAAAKPQSERLQWKVESGDELASISHGGNLLKISANEPGEVRVSARVGGVEQSASVTISALPSEEDGAQLMRGILYALVILAGVLLLGAGLAFLKSRKKSQ